MNKNFNGKNKKLLRDVMGGSDGIGCTIDVQLLNDISLNIRSFHWRTWSYKTLSNKRYIGPWRVDIASNDGKLLQSINFEVN